MSGNSESGVCKFPIAGELTIFRTAELKALILPVINEHKVIEIDLSQVTEIDGAGLLLMISIKLEVLQQDKALRYVGHSGAVTEALDICNLSGFFGDPIVLSSHKGHS